MKILALEFSSAQRSVAVLSTDNPAPLDNSLEVIETGTLSTQAFGMIDEVLRQAHFEREQIECVAVGLGPGSYTGIRAAIAVAQGWQLASGAKLLGVSSADCLAAQAQAEGLAGPIAVVIDAQRGEFYLANYESSRHAWRQVQTLRLATLRQVQQCDRAGELVLGPEVTQRFPAGRVVYPRAATLARLASGRTDFVAGEKLEPIYLRQTQFVKAPPPRLPPPG
jgi:tRNA threonylcarbamoyladenosine biosynthesis protein TsaB